MKLHLFLVGLAREEVQLHRDAIEDCVAERPERGFISRCVREIE
jgi:hypothetical protein